MSGGYGSEKNGVSLGVFWDSVSLNSDGSQARLVGAEIRIHRDVNISDSTNKLSWSGGAVNDGSDSNINVGGSGNKTIKSVTGQWQDLEYGSTKSASFAASMSGVDYAGGTISVSKSVTYPARAYAAPIAPTDLGWTQTSIGNFTLTWTNQATTAAPWTTVVLVRTEVGGATTEIPVSSTASSITQNGMALDKRYTWYLRITNPTSTVASAPTAMTPIPLHSMTLSASSVAIGGSVTFTINKYGSSNLSTIYFIKNGVKTIVWDKQSGTSFTYTFTQADWAAFLPNETSKVFVVGIETFAGTTSLGAQTQNLTVTVPAAAPYLPDATAPTRSEQVAVIGTAFGTNVFIKNKSRIRYTWSGSAGASATITKREILITRSWQSGQSVIDVTSASGYMYEEVPTGNGTVTVASRTTDSRGRVDTSDNATFTVYNYADPVINTFTVTRCDSAGNTNNSGTYIKFTINVAATSVNPGSEANQMQFRIRLLDSSGNETGSDLYAKELNNTLTASLTTGALGGGAYSAQAGYSFRLTLNDNLTNAKAVPITKITSISSEVYPLTIGTNGIAIGKVYNDSTKALDVVGDVQIVGKFRATGLVGVIQMFGGVNPPDGALLCTGAVYDPLQYPTLYEIIGYTYGGTAVLPQLPNLQGRVPVGPYSGDSRVNALGKTGGEFDHDLQITEIPKHTHAIPALSGTATSAGSHSHEEQFWANNYTGLRPIGGSAGGATSGTPKNLAVDSGGLTSTTAARTLADGAHTHPVTTVANNTGSSGGDGAHNNMQPFTVVNFIIWAK